MNANRLLQRILWVALVGLPLWPQSYQTSFSEVNVDRVKANFAENSLYQVEPASGTLNLNIPLGPGIGQGSIHYTPAVTGRMAQQLSHLILDDGWSANAEHWEVDPTIGLSFLPGYLDLKTGPAGDIDMQTFVSRYELSNGLAGSFDGPITAQETQVDGLSLIRVFGYQTETVALMKPFGLDSSCGSACPFVKYTTSGDLFIALYDPVTAPLLNLSSRS